MAYELVSWVPGRDRDSAGSLCCVLEENTILSFWPFFTLEYERRIVRKP